MTLFFMDNTHGGKLWAVLIFYAFAFIIFLRINDTIKSLFYALFVIFFYPLVPIVTSIARGEEVGNVVIATFFAMLLFIWPIIFILAVIKKVQKKIKERSQV